MCCQHVSVVYWTTLRYIYIYIIISNILVWSTNLSISDYWLKHIVYKKIKHISWAEKLDLCLKYVLCKSIYYLKIHSLDYISLCHLNVNVICISIYITFFYITFNCKDTEVNRHLLESLLHKVYCVYISWPKAGLRKCYNKERISAARASSYI